MLISYSLNELGLHHQLVHACLPCANRSGTDVTVDMSDWEGSRTPILPEKPSSQRGCSTALIASALALEAGECAGPRFRRSEISWTKARPAPVVSVKT